MEGQLVEFLRKRDYTLVRELGQGACGKTVLLKDDLIDERFVCKKYVPFSETHRQELFRKFLDEIKLLHRVYHENVVRVFNYYVYPDHFAGFILMEYILGTHIDEYLKRAPEQTSEIFVQVINGFRYLENHGILHRDIRPANLMVRDDGTVKIIDLGFGKQVQYPEDFEKSISLNWWCEPPYEFGESVYDFKTEVYFVGKLFESIITENSIDHFAYSDILRRMCTREPARRLQTFSDVDKEISGRRVFEIGFTDQEISAYRKLADCLSRHFRKIRRDASYVTDIERIQNHLDGVHRSIMLEDTAPDAAPILRSFVSGMYHYITAGFPVQVVKDFVMLLKSTTQEKKRIILTNLHARLDAITRYDDPPDDFPF